MYEQWTYALDKVMHVVAEGLIMLCFAIIALSPIILALVAAYFILNLFGVKR